MFWEKYLRNSKIELLPIGERFYKDLFAESPKSFKLQHAFEEIACERVYRKFLKMGRESTHLTTAEKIQVKTFKQQPTTCSVFQSLFTANLLQHDTRLTKTEFTVVARQFVWLPALKNPIGESFDLLCGCEGQLCGNLACRADSKLDVSGNHGLVCHPGVKAQKATLFERALENLFRNAGGTPTRQPSTYSLLGGFFSKEDLSRLFSGKLTKEQTDERKRLAMRFLDILAEHPRGRERTNELGLLKNSLQLLLLQQMLMSVIRMGLFVLI